MPVQDLEMGIEKILKIAHARGSKTLNLCSWLNEIFEFILTLADFNVVCKRQDAISKLKAEVS